VNFTGQVRIPEVDHPGVPATIVVEGDQTEVFLEGESLGRWSLFDVHASRLVSSAFALSLAGEEVTFIADEPVDFAYKGVDHMAEAWARFKSMSLPRRMVAVGRSRRGTVASRISELREAMLYNLESAGRPAARLVPIEILGRASAETASWTKRIDAYSNVPEPLDAEGERGPRRTVETVAPIVEIVSADDHIAAVFEPAPIEDQEPVAGTIAAEPTEEVAPRSGTARLRPGPGLIPRSVDRPPSGEPDQVLASPPERRPLADSPWDEPPMEAEPPHDDIPSEGSEEYYEESTPPDPVPEPAAAAGPALSVEAGEQQQPDGDPALSRAPDEAEGLTTASPKDEGGRHEVVVDLGHFEGGEEAEAVADHFEPPDEPGSPETVKEPVLVSAPVPPAERGGLLGAVRSAFARNRVSHQHEFVEAPGGIGIVRQICAECGYISIGVND
jgi:hypothetical protein